MIAIIDYGMGNLRSVSKAFEAVGHQAMITRDASVIRNASHVVLPGVGAFGDCMANLKQYQLVEPIKGRFSRESRFGHLPGIPTLVYRKRRVWPP